MDAGSRGEGQSAQGDYGTDDRRGFRGTAENAKTKICMRWKEGHCRFGDRCNFAHGQHELRKLPARDGEAGGSGDYPSRGGYGQGYGPQGVQSAGGYDNGGYGYNRPAYSGGGAMGSGGAYRGGRGAANNQAWAASGYPVSGPGGWTQYRTPENGEPYYHNMRTGETTWDKPAGWGP